MEREAIKSRAIDYLEQEQHPDFIGELQELLDSEAWDELEERFYTELAFGTGGLRGIIGAGYNRMNPFVVKRATQGLASYIVDASETEDPSVVIAYDSRRYSRVFAEVAASVFCGNGIKTYLFESLRPTPELSFAVRELSASSGIVVTASHNPSDYNGYKVYWSDGGQVVPPHDNAIIDRVRSITDRIHTQSIEDAKKGGRLVEIGEEIDDAYVDMVKGRTIRGNLFEKAARDLTLVYTPLHGTGGMLIERILGELGVNVVSVAEQREPDGMFPTVQYPNPEEAEAMALALEYGKRHRADLVMGTDPDADRLGIAVPKGDEFVLITGNQLGSLLSDYILSAKHETDSLPEHPVIVKTIVTTELQRAIAHSYGAETIDVLTGFKYIAEVMRNLEGTDKTYVFGGEESYGYLVETEVRDKDAVSAAVLTTELALYERSRGRTVLDRLNDIYDRHGYYEEILRSFTFKGAAGLEKIASLMKSWRDTPPADIAGIEVSESRDYLTGLSTRIADGATDTISLPRSNVLQFVLADGSVVTGRPSGTEPKIKFYASCRADPGTTRPEAESDVRKRIAAISAYLESLTG